MAVERRYGFTMLKQLIKKMQNHLHLSRKMDILHMGLECEEVEGIMPFNLKEGHFAIVTKNDKDEPIRFVLELCVLKNPGFLRLLKMAEEEYGFQQGGALAVPCLPEELLRILQVKIFVG
ncbi:hypothetical protein ABFS82_10G092300 [Erythranthe guttata]|uniref:uncharacterized protein LOC105966303 n=1 Tax=Erythranthe guttata TaxID=4155 RepID=UPI00064DA8B7|nr:PREDICTED: uncharacterized protein LOC105966303 [Erythranthe guttata]|eukprot:XP_012846323.1 PREDICTED: uncharacterized protein LOC105966303 [Erythranthe guttata]